MERVSFNFGDIISGRSVVGDTILDLGKRYENVWAVTADTGMPLSSFKKEFPERYVDVGIAEQNCIGVAAGLALEGNRPFVMGMIPFLTMRSCEQVRTAVCYQNLPVRIIGTGGGLTSGGGSTHNAMEDISIMKTFVNMNVMSIADPLMIEDILNLSMDVDGPMFIRLSPGKKDMVLYEPGTHTYGLGKGLIAQDGKDVTVFAHGEMVPEALAATDALAAEGISVRVADMYSIKPLDEELVLKCTEETQNVVVLEDHLMYGGLASSIADLYADKGVCPKTFKRMGIPQVYAGFGEGPDQRRKYGYDTEALIAQIKKQLG